MAENDNVTVVNLSNTDHWLRVLLTVVYALIFWLGVWVACAVVVLNLLVLLFTGQRNDSLTDFGRTVSNYLAEILHYATQSSDARPFPFAENDSAGPAVAQNQPVKTGAAEPTPPKAANKAPVVKPAADPKPAEEPLKTGPTSASTTAATAKKKKKKKTTTRKKKVAKKVSSDQSADQSAEKSADDSGNA